MKFTIGFWYEVNGKCDIEAKSEEEAKTKVKSLMAYSGLDDLKNVDYMDRNYGVI